MEADSYSVQGAKIVSLSHTMLSANEHHGRRRVCYFNYTVPTGNEADDNHLFAAKLPEGARLLGGEICCDGAGTGAQVDVGLAGFDGSGYYDKAGTLADDDDLLGAAIDIAAAGRDEFNNTIATNFGLVLDKPCWLVLTVENAVWTAAKIIRGSIEYVVD